MPGTVNIAISISIPIPNNNRERKKPTKNLLLFQLVIVNTKLHFVCHIVAHSKWAEKDLWKNRRRLHKNKSKSKKKPNID